MQRLNTIDYNSTYYILADQWLNEALGFVLSLVQADRLVLRNRQALAESLKKPA